MEFQKQLINRCIVFMILSLHFDCSFKVIGHCPATVKHRILLPKFQLRRLIDTDWLGCIVACDNEPSCFSYNFCFREIEDLGICDLNRCWVEENKHYGKDSLLVYASGCVFQQLPKKISQGFPVCQREEKPKEPRWMKVNLSSICLSTTANVQVVMPASGQVTGMKLAFVSGSITCNKSDPKCAGKWGCSCCKICTRGYTNKRLDIIITNANNNRIFPSNRYPSSHNVWYAIPNQTNEDENLVFPNLTVPLTVKRNEPLVVWYSIHLLDRGPAWSISNGRVCFNVYVFYTKTTD
ncbi:uncharacterized protein LOC116292205 [Actinia tenebrosa]|uniref:Uncharacterized protein LOC116292205 n=1 Tax=Actinia tenebrosa TaxID=6105 RepID=A0A6P8HFY9_ACTTE|nr:uncharacterized protein LOC116292205 [Actinia tenebrosa]